MSNVESPETGTPIVARASGEYRIKRYIMVAVIVGMGAWFGYDGFKAWPEENARIEQIKQRQRETSDQDELTKLAAELKKLKPHTDTDIALQKVLCFVLPPLGLAYLVWTLYNSRGRYRLEGTKLSVPGHPEIELDQITAIDKQLWDRKGIAYIDYDVAGRTGRLKLDDFVYQPQPTREIFKRVEAHTLARVAGAGPEAGSQE